MAEDKVAWDKLISEIKKVLLDIKLSIFVFVVTSFVMFIPQEWATFLGVATFRTDHKQWISIIFVAFLFILPIHFIAWLISRSKAKSKLKKQQERLCNLTIQEKEIVKKYIDNQSRTAELNNRSGVVGGLVEATILWRVGNEESPSYESPYNLQNWAWDYLTEFPEILD